VATIVSVGALLSSFGNLAANMIANPRLIFALAEQGDFPGSLSTIHSQTLMSPLFIALAVLLWALPGQEGFPLPGGVVFAVVEMLEIADCRRLCATSWQLAQARTRTRHA
jgi:amino acid transporter